MNYQDFFNKFYPVAYISDVQLSNSGSKHIEVECNNTEVTQRVINYLYEQGIKFNQVVINPKHLFIHL